MICNICTTHHNYIFLVFTSYKYSARKYIQATPGDTITEYNTIFIFKTSQICGKNILNMIYTNKCLMLVNKMKKDAYNVVSLLDQGNH